jgi:hypothetical protein
MAPLTSNLTISSLSHPDANSNITLAAFHNATSTTANTSEPSSDFTGTIIFGVITSVLAIMAIIIGYLQLRKASLPAIPLLPITLPAAPPASVPTQLPTPASERLPAPASAPAAKDDV